MSQDANKILTQILGVVSQINNKLEGTGGKKPTGKADVGTGGTSKLFGSKKAKEGADVMKGVLMSIINFSKAKIDPKHISKTAKALDELFNVVIKVGKSSRTAINAMKLFDSLTESLKQMTPFVKALNNLLLSIGLTILIFAGGLVLAGKILGVRTIWVIPIIILSITLLAGGLAILGKAQKWVKPGYETAKGMGEAFAYLGLGLVVFVGSWKLIAFLLGVGQGMRGMGVAALVIVGVIVAMAGVFALIGLGEKWIKSGVNVAIGMAIGMAALSLGVLSMVLVAKLITGMGVNKDGTKKNDKNTKFGALMSEIGPGLGVIGIVLVSAGLLFAGLGALAAVIIPGVITGVLMAGGMILFALATKKLLKVAGELGEPGQAKETISNMVEGVFGGLIEGVTSALNPTGQKGLKGFAAGIKNTAILMTGIGTLISVSIALSMFAKALTAFATLDNMRVIKSYNEKTGEPVFGETVDIAGVGDTVAKTLYTFLRGTDGNGGLLGATEGLRRIEGGAINRMARALTGRRGMLTAIIDFADVLKTFAQFGPEGKIGYVEMIPDGTDEDGNAKFKQVPHSIKILDVTKVITDSIGQFSEGIVNGVEGISNRDKRKILNMSEALMGKKRSRVGGWVMGENPGLLEPINAFSETLMIYAKFGEAGGVPELNAEGNPTGKSISIKDIVKNIVVAISTFSSELSSQLTAPGETVNQAQKKMEGYMGLLEQLSVLSVASEGLDKTAVSIMSMATSMKALSESVNSFELDKLQVFGEIAKSNNSFGSFINKSQDNKQDRREEKAEKAEKEEKIEEKVTTESDSSSSSTSKTSSSTPQPVINTTELANAVATAVGASVAAVFRQGHFQFEFATDKSGVLSLSQ